MKPFTVLRPDSTHAALVAGALPNAKFLGGGTNLVDLLKLGVETPDVLVDLTHLALDNLTVASDGTLDIGAMVRNSDLASHSDVQRLFPVLSQAVLDGASGQIRNVATVAGNLLQRTRCPYFQDISKPCNKRQPDSGCPAVSGDHHNLAILGASDACIATHPSDMAVALVALDAHVVVQTLDDEHEVPIEQIYATLDEDPTRETTLPTGALITRVRVPSSPAAARSAYRKARDRASFAFAVGSVAAAVELDNDQTVADVRLAFGGVAPVPWRARTAEAALTGQTLTLQRAHDALAEEFAAARPLPGNAFKVDLVSSMAQRLLLDVAAGSGPRA